MERKRPALLGTTAAGVLMSLAAFAPALAQENTTTTNNEPEETAQTARESDDNIVVVGSRIRRDEFTSTSPIQVITREESTLAGLASTAEILQGTSVTGGNNQINNYFGGFVTDGGPGANTLSLRGLGATRTLILLNGRRLAPAGTRGAVGAADLNVLPNAIVERIEILKDGASSIYGSDAVAGVVNIITERGVEGWTFDGQYNVTESGGGEQLRAAIVGGYTADNWEISGSFEYYDRTELALRDRGWTQCNTDNFRNPTTGASLDFIDPLTGQPKCYPITSTGSNGVTINTIGTNNITGVSAAGAPAGPRLFNRWRPNSAVTTGLVGFEGVGGTGVNLNVRDTFDPRMLNRSLISPATTYTGYLQGALDLPNFANSEAYFEFLYSRRQSSQTGYRQLSVDYPRFSPLIPANLQSSVFLSVPAGTTPYPTGVRAFIGFGNDTSSQEVDFYRLTAGLNGDFLIPGWRYDTSVTYSMSDANYTFQSFLTDRLNASMQVVASGAGFVCAPATALPGCVAGPVLTSQVIGGVLPQAWVNYIFQPVTGNTQYNEATFLATIDGPVFELPAGEVMAAFGFEYRLAEIDDTPPIDSQTGNLYNLTSATPTRGDDNVWEVFAEVEVPILANQPFAENLTLNLSGRYTEYDSYGADETYKAGLAWAPTEWLAFRASYGTSYRAPALFEQFQGGTSGFLAASADPCNGYGSLPTTSVRFINCNAEINDLSFTSTRGVTVISAGGAVLGLEAETSTNESIGLIFQPELPSAFGDLSIAVDYYNIEVENQVDNVGGTSLLTLCYDDPQFRAGGGYCNFILPREAGTGALTVRDVYTNISTQIAEGYDYNIRWVRDIADGTFRLNVGATQYLSQSSALLPGDPLDEFNGWINTPEWTGSMDAQYRWKEWNFFYQLNYVQATSDEERFGIAQNTTQFDITVPDYFTENVSVSYTSTNDWQLTAGVRNLHDVEPPTISSGIGRSRVGNAPLYSGYDYFGRQFFVRLQREF